MKEIGLMMKCGCEEENENAVEEFGRERISSYGLSALSAPEIQVAFAHCQNASFAEGSSEA